MSRWGDKGKIVKALKETAKDLGYERLFRWPTDFGFEPVDGVLGMAGQLDAQPSRYTLDDVMDKLIEMDKRLVQVETKVDRLEKRLAVP